MKPFILVTGASGGIGRAISTLLAANGYNLYLHYNTNQLAIDQLSKEIEYFGGEYIPVKADLSSQQGPEILAKQIFSVNGIILNSGKSHYGLMEEVEELKIMEMVQLHVTSPYTIVKKLLPKIKRDQTGSIVAVTSIWGQTGAACEVLYSMVKGGQHSFIKALAKELALSGIRVNAVSPGAIQTDMLSQFSMEDLESLMDEIPMGRLGLPNEIAEAILFLLSEKSSYITGQILSVNGGWYT
ncbi:elongation factor P 5-aminopentanone reductase [Peribacillus alkalitolerans]|uniref:elongation factor P 5-aminopentanone reductase n=1 Tax=Peribacillus alkalitolerans TaxID=1550385 RepID=UPI0013D7A08C|nr:SDR family oxidoreductase [Peribacillus alkalitolerans]